MEDGFVRFSFIDEDGVRKMVRIEPDDFIERIL